MNENKEEAQDITEDEKDKIEIEKKEDIYSNIDEMLGSTLKSEEDD